MKKRIIFLASLAALSLASCGNEITTGNASTDVIATANTIDNSTNKNNDNRVSLEPIDILGKAAYLALHGKTSLNSYEILLNDDILVESTEENNYYTYPFDKIVINEGEAYTFTIDENETRPELEKIVEACGTGNLEFIIFSFETSIEGVVDVEDTGITITGENGQYTILENSWTLDKSDNGYDQLFSSHKKITSKSVDKDFNGPFYGINISNKKSGYTISFGKNENSIVSIGKTNVYFDVDTKTKEVIEEKQEFDVSDLVEI